MDENFTPSTPTEVMLLNEIRKLKIQIYEMRKLDPYILNDKFYQDDIVLQTQKELPEQIKLVRTARMIASINPIGGVQVRLDAVYGNNEKFGSQYMHSEPVTKEQAADLLIHLHQKQLHVIGSFLTK